MEDILKYPIIPRDIYTRYRDLKKRPVTNGDSLWALLFGLCTDALKKDGSQVSNLAKLILFDLKNNLNHPSVYKEKHIASALEARLALLGDGRTSDSLPKTNPEIQYLLNPDEIEKLPSSVISIACSNFREKGDLIFFDPRIESTYKVSIKSLISDNPEINFGAFKFASLIEDIGDERLQSMGERKSNIEIQIDDQKFKAGRGSKPQLYALFNYLRRAGKFLSFQERWRILSKAVFKEDIIVYMKRYDALEMYLISNSSFQNCMLESLEIHVDNPSNSAINRWEGNSIRMDRDKLLSYADFRINRSFNEFFDESRIIAELNRMQSLKISGLTNI